MSQIGAVWLSPPVLFELSTYFNWKMFIEKNYFGNKKYWCCKNIIKPKKHIYGCKDDIYQAYLSRIQLPHINILGFSLLDVEKLFSEEENIPHNFYKTSWHC